VWDQILQTLVPFNLLTKKDHHQLLESGIPQSFHVGELILNVSDDEEDSIYLLGKGSVKVVSDQGGFLGRIQAPAYFGERAPLFHTPRLFNIEAEERVECLRIPAALFFELLHTRPAFSQCFSSMLQDKLHIFEDYHQFLALISRGKKNNLLNLSDLVEGYRLLNPILHSGSSSEEIDWGALTYVMGRLPLEIASTCSIFLTEDPPLMYRDLLPQTRCKIKSDPKRYCHQIMPGKLLFVLRDQNTDLIDLVTKLCIYIIESYKIRKRISPHPHMVQNLGEYFLNEKSSRDEDELWDMLPFSKNEKIKLKELFGDDVLSLLYTMVVQHADISLHFLSAQVRYFSIASEQWILELQKQFNDIIQPIDELGDAEIHIVSSNLHSIHNCLSPWLRIDKEFSQYVSEARSQTGLSELNDSDFSYVIAREFFKENPDKDRNRHDFDTKHGITHIQTTHLTGIKVNLIDLSKVDYSAIDPLLGELKPAGRRKVIINIDYAYGAEQAAAVMRNMLLMFGKNISSISVIGKSGGIIGNRGDILLPQRAVVQNTNNSFPITCNDLWPEDFDDEQLNKEIHTGTLLTVEGALMQSRETLLFYHHFWNAIGMEMEASHYLKAIAQAQQHHVINEDVPLRFAYYTSDTPLADPKKTLAYQLAAHEGIPSVYAITRVILRKILS